ncbi:ABC transporter permease [Gordonia paraffinivorans]|uniref:Doxorubicin resistance ABC transporter permease protein drrB n=1 Tax=Gordonia paraffinivorans TaxID=175628 RepID=A0ABD7V1D4_9ACTN|nr:ABC transporter permease [Gordonia paraffinivorans]MCD2146752.1 ABC transporter permease [Gordonia paraffinivorans]VFA88048.1 Doxorubicin resistance ABC transporter permease protein drrB [Gordonia paraffinivorans]
MSAPVAVATELRAPVQPRSRPVQQWWTLSGRGVATVFRNGEFVFAFLSPVLLAVCFYLPLSSVMDVYGVDYAQFLMPIIVLQSVGFAASSAAMRASWDDTAGINTRFRALPMPPIVPMFARLTTNAFLLVVSVFCATIACLVIGWRPMGGAVGTLSLYAVAIIVGLLIALLADGIGLVAGSPQATSQALMLPSLILGMTSSGFVPVAQFPEWIQPFVRNQPISQFVNVMRASDSGDLTVEILTPTLWWCVGMFVAAILLMRFGNRKVRA